MCARWREGADAVDVDVVVAGADVVGSDVADSENPAAAADLAGVSRFRPPA